MKHFILAFVLVVSVTAGTLIAGTGAAVPEIDPTGLSSAVALLAGGCLIAVSKFRRRR